ncbi:MAG TPA: glycosyltransferase family 39 protein [Patescibacteria group bacterium]|nr:glycosyltransferase family 39 protein [Patescibacteria group bacterium]
MIKNILQKINPSLFIIVFIAAFVRFAAIMPDLSSSYTMPPSLNWDEVSHGYNAYSILKTEKDEWGEGFPVIFRAYGDYKLPVYIYLTAVSERIFGLNEFAVRLPSALAGIGTVIFTFPLAMKLLKDKQIAVLSALLVAIEPWSVFLSRGAFEANLALFFVVSGIYFFLKSTEKIRFLPLSVTLLGLSVWTYNSARVVVPILFLVLVLSFHKELKKLLKKHNKTLAFSLISLAIFFVPMFIQLVKPEGQARYGKVSIISEGAIAGIEEARNTSKLPPVVNRLVNNRAVYFGKSFAANWFSHFSSSFLFFTGGSDYQFSIPGKGLLYPVNIAPLIIGLVYLVKKKSKESLILLAWFLAAPVPSAITNEAPHVLRSILTIPTPMIISAVGFLEIAKWLKKKIKVPEKSTLVVYLILIYAFLENYALTYAFEYREKYSWSWQYGYRQVVTYAKEHYFDYDRIIVSKKYGEPHEFFLFYMAWDPERFQNDPELIRFGQSGWFWVDRFDKFFFVNDWQVPKSDSQPFVLESKGTFTCKTVRCLLVSSPGNYPKGWRLIETINFLDGSPAFDIVTNIR